MNLCCEIVFAFEWIKLICEVILNLFESGIHDDDLVVTISDSTTARRNLEAGDLVAGDEIG